MKTQGEVTVKSTGRNYFRIFLAILLAGGLLYAFYNVIDHRIQGRSNLRQMEEITKPILKSIHDSERMECNTSVILKIGDEKKEDTTKKMGMIHDFRHKRMQVSYGESRVIFEYDRDELHIYSKGVSPIYNKRETKLQRVRKDRWIAYPTEKIFGLKQRKGENDRLSYGYLNNREYLAKIQDEGKVLIGEQEYKKYKAVVRNTIKDPKAEENKNGNGFRKILSAHGLSAMDLKKEYPEVYKKLKDIYYRDTEDLYIWLDENGDMARIEKDYTFTYYLDIMKQNSEKIYDKVGQYQYPDVICQQNYTYNPTCGRVEMPGDFEEL